MSVKTLQEVFSPRVFMIPDQKFRSQASGLNTSPIKRKSIEFETSKAVDSRRVSKDTVSNKSFNNKEAAIVNQILTNRAVQTDFIDIVKSGKSESIVALSGSQISSFATSTSRVSSSVITGSKPDVSSIKTTKNKKKKK